MRKALSSLDPTRQLGEREIAAFEASRALPPSARVLGCYAPVRTMSFHPTGKVLSCARKPSTILGDIRTQRLDDIWNSALRQAMVDALGRYEYPAGCAVCSSYIAAGDYLTADAVRTYDMEPTYKDKLDWPSRLEFNLSNTCGLQCLMCSGDYSSAIRAKREKLPPLRSPYDDQFFADIRKYLGRASCAVFLGGEPFNQRECFRIWDMLIGEQSPLHCYVNTNGMVFNDRVERLLEKLHMTIAISFDGATAKTVEMIRKGASFATMLNNAKQFGQRVGKNGGSLIFNFCPMRSNWHEFADFLLLAEQHEASAYVNTMADPEEMSLYYLPRAELQEVVATLEKQAEALDSQLRRTKPAMTNLIGILRNKLAVTDRESLRVGLTKAVNGWTGPDVIENSEATRRAANYVERGRRVLATPSYPGTLALNHARGNYPFYAERSKDAFFWDSSGRKYLDWYMSGGAVALGHNNPAVTEAISKQIERGVNLSQPATLEIELAERLCALIPTAEMVAFGKNGTDVTSAAIKLARIVTGREHLAICGYHGFQDWSWAAEPNSAGIPSAYRDLVHSFPFNDLAAVTALMNNHGSKVAAIVIEPVRYENADARFLSGLRELADKHGALLIFDEVVTGFRVARGGVQELTGVLPDVTCLAKSIANGMPLAALVGLRRWMRHLPATNFGMTYRFEGLSLAAACASLDLFRDVDVSGHLRKIGELMQDGFTRAAQRNGLDWRLDAHPALSYFRIDGAGRLTQRGAEDLFAQVCLRSGFFIRMPRLLPSLAHTEEHVEQTLVVIEDAMRTVSKAQDHGLEGLFDGPIWPELQHPLPSKVSSKFKPRPMHYQNTVVPFPFNVHPSGFEPSALDLTVSSADDSSSASIENAEVLLRIGKWSHSTPAVACADVRETFSNPAVIEGTYAIDEMPRNNAYVMVQLCVTDAAGASVIASHDLVFGGQPSSRAQVGAEQKSMPCPYGVASGTFRIAFRKGHVRIEHQTEWADDLGEYRFKASGPLRLSFRLYGSLEGGPAQVRLTSLSVVMAHQTSGERQPKHPIRKLANALLRRF